MVGRNRKTLRVLILFPKVYWDRKMSLARRHIIDELMRRDTEAIVKRTDDVCVTLSGVGWPNYHDALTLEKNIDHFGKVDVLYWYKPLGAKDCAPLHKCFRRKGVRACEAFNEAWWTNGLAANLVNESNTDLVICHHKTDIKQFESPKTSATVTHIPHAASQQLFQRAARPWKDRDIPILVTGALDSKIYPVRTQIARLVKSGAVPGVIVPHPGYRLGSHEDVRRQEQEYANLLGRSKFSVVCSSIYKYGLSKYAESAMAGAVPIGDVPPDYEKTIGKLMLCVEPLESDSEVAEKINDALAEDYAGVSQEIMDVAVHSHSMEEYVDKLLKELRSLASCHA